MSEQEIASTSPLLSDEELDALREQQDNRSALYKSGDPGFRESYDAIDLLLGHIAASSANTDDLIESADGLIDEQNQRINELEAVLKAIIEDCTLSVVYVGDFYKDATKKIKARAQWVLAKSIEEIELSTDDVSK